MILISGTRLRLAAGGVHAHWLRGIPAPIAALFAMNVVLILIPVVDFWLGSPVREFRKLINLDAETTLQAWYSSMQWFCAGFLFSLSTLHAYRSRLRGLMAMAAFAMACIAFSIDEIAGIHEWLGHKADALLPGASRKGPRCLIRAYGHLRSAYRCWRRWRSSSSRCGASSFR